MPTLSTEWMVRNAEPPATLEIFHWNPARADRFKNHQDIVTATNAYVLNLKIIEHENKEIDYDHSSHES